MHEKIYANVDRFLMSTLWPAWQALIGEGEGGIQAKEREGRAGENRELKQQRFSRRRRHHRTKKPGARVPLFPPKCLN